MGSSAGHWISVHIVHNNGELLKLLFIQINSTLECPLNVDLQLLFFPLCPVCSWQGGLKAVIWTDVFQTIVMFAGQLAVIVVGVQQTGGVSEVWRKVREGNRISALEWVHAVVFVGEWPASGIDGEICTQMHRDLFIF